ncbi:nucleotide excision repair TFIIH subunit [Lactarius tabidus]
MVWFTDIGVSKPVSVLLSLSDSAVKQILLTLDERPGQSFIIEDLDEFHVLIRADEEQRVRRELEAELEKNTYSMEP